MSGIARLSEDPFIIRKSDGGFGYATTDVATIEYRVQQWHADSIWYVVGAPQHLHFQQLFSLARRLGYDLDLQHIAFGSILGEDRKLMRTRSGESVSLRALLDEAVSRATAIVAEKNPGLSESGARRNREDCWDRRDQIRRSIPVPHDRLRLFLGQDVIAAGEYCTISSERLRA